MIVDYIYKVHKFTNYIVVLLFFNLNCPIKFNYKQTILHFIIIIIITFFYFLNHISIVQRQL